MNIQKTLAAIALIPFATISAAADFSITPITADTFRWGVNIDGGPQEINPTLFLARGQTYTFDITTTSTHPFWIKTQSGTGNVHGYTGGGLSANGVTTAKTITFAVPQTAPEGLFYNCAQHSTMAGKIEMVIFRDSFD